MGVKSTESDGYFQPRQRSYGNQQINPCELFARDYFQRKKFTSEHGLRKRVNVALE